MGHQNTDTITDRSSDLWIPSVDCSSAGCVNHRKYNPAGSSSALSVPYKSLNIRYGDGSTTIGTVWTDNVTISGLTANAQTIGAATALSADWASDPMDGLMGMAFQSVSQMAAPPFFQTVRFHFYDFLIIADEDDAVDLAIGSRSTSILIPSRL